MQKKRLTKGPTKTSKHHKRTQQPCLTKGAGPAQLRVKTSCCFFFDSVRTLRKIWCGKFIKILPVAVGKGTVFSLDEVVGISIYRYTRYTWTSLIFCGKLEGKNIEYYMNILMDPMGYRQMPKYLVSYWKENLPPPKTKTYPNYGRGLAHLPG